MNKKNVRLCESRTQSAAEQKDGRASQKKKRENERQTRPAERENGFAINVNARG